MDDEPHFRDTNAALEPDYTRYRPAWIAIYRRQSVAKALRYAALGVLVISWLGLVPKPPTRLTALVLALASLAAHIVIRCPRCGAWWRLGSDDDGQRKPCKRCGLRWGQEDEAPDVS